MTRKKELGPQYTFLKGDTKIRLPEQILDEENGLAMRRAISSRKLWLEKPKGECLYVDLNSGSPIKSFNPDTWQVLDDIGKEEGVSNKKFSGLVLKSSEITQEDSSLIEEDVGVLSGNLKKQSPVFLFEKKGEQREGLIGTEILKRAGLVKTNLLKRVSPNHFFTEARTEVKRKPRKRVDLTDKKRRSYGFYRKKWREMRREYWKVGYKLVNQENSELLNVLRSSSFPPRERSRLEMGWGVEVENKYCGCRFRIDLNGDTEKLWWCGQCSEEAPKIIKSQE